MAFTNVTDPDATVFALARKGYGTVNELAEWDTPEILDLVEFEQIQQDIERYKVQEREREQRGR